MEREAKWETCKMQHFTALIIIKLGSWTRVGLSRELLSGKSHELSISLLVLLKTFVSLWKFRLLETAVGMLHCRMVFLLSWLFFFVFSNTTVRFVKCKRNKIPALSFAHKCSCHTSLVSPFSVGLTPGNAVEDFLTGNKRNSPQV